MSGSNRVLRGGNWNNDSGNCRAANRNNNNNPGNSNNNIGFRFVRSSEDSPHGVHDSGPAAIPAAPFHPARQSETTGNKRQGGNGRDEWRRDAANTACRGTRQPRSHESINDP